MKRLHINIGVDDLNQSIKFYNALFGAEPVKTKDDYAKWMLDDPFVNFAISSRTPTTGIDHLGIQVEEDTELEQLRERLKQADMSLFDEGEATCCYARSEKSWVKDPSGVAWEAYRTMEDVNLFAGSTSVIEEPNASTKPQSTCCPPQTS